MKGKYFKEPLFHKVICGEMTRFREIIKPQPDADLQVPEEGFVNFDGEYCSGRQRVLRQTVECRYDDNGRTYPHYSEDIDIDVIVFPVKPRYKVGETVYLKERYIVFEDEYGNPSEVIYKYRELFESNKLTWQNKLFMPAKYARYFIKITSVRCERLQAISDSDCVKEGITINPDYDSDVRDEKILVASSHYLVKYADLIDTMHGKGTWESNPYVWVYDFELTNASKS
jgi:hypothetical protein